MSDGEEAAQLERGCRICMAAEIAQPMSVKGCGHTFCHACIHKWAGHSKSPRCPLCKQELVVLVAADGTAEEVQAGTHATEEGGPDLSCLDHNYFLQEVTRLLSRAGCAQRALYRSAYSCGRRSGWQADASLDQLEQVVGLLESKREVLRAEVRFDPQELLSELYQLDGWVTALQNGRSEGLEQLAQHMERWQGAAAAGYGEEEGGSSDWDEEEQHIRSSLSRTPGRKPPNRSNKRQVAAGGGSGSAGHPQAGGGGSRGGGQQRTGSGSGGSGSRSGSQGHVRRSSKQGSWGS